jgi:hypothetical protein
MLAKLKEYAKLTLAGIFLLLVALFLAGCGGGGGGGY